MKSFKIDLLAEIGRRKVFWVTKGELNDELLRKWKLSRNRKKYEREKLNGTTAD